MNDEIKYFLLIFAASVLLFSLNSSAQTQTFTTTGAGKSFTVPAGVAIVTVECRDGGIEEVPLTPIHLQKEEWLWVMSLFQ